MVYSNRQIALLPSRAIGAAVTGEAGTEVAGLEGCDFAALQAAFLYGAGGTTVKLWIQTSLDKGVTWFDIASFAFTTAAGVKLQVVNMTPGTAFTPATVPGAAALADNTVLNGILGDRFRTFLKTTGTYTGLTSIAVDAVFKGRPAR